MYTECRRCGAVVRNAEAHDAFHRALIEALAERPNETTAEPTTDTRNQPKEP